MKISKRAFKNKYFKLMLQVSLLLPLVNVFRSVILLYYIVICNAFALGFCRFVILVLLQQLTKLSFFMCNVLRQASASPGGTAKILTVQSLAKWVRAEFEIFKVFLKIILDEKVAQAKGNQFAQAVHDGGTLTNKRKYQAFGLQFIDPQWRKNLVICLGFERCSDGTDAAVATQFHDTLFRHFGHRFADIVSTVIQDRCAKVNTLPINLITMLFFSLLL
jgi:hypothetical protein